MQLTGIDMQRISLGALIIALALLVDDAMTTSDAMLTRLAAGDDKEEAARFAFTHLCLRHARRHLRHHRRLRAGRLRASSAGEYTFSLFAVVTIALLVSWLVAVVFAPLMGVLILKPPEAAGPARAAARRPLVQELSRPGVAPADG